MIHVQFLLAGKQRLSSHVLHAPVRSVSAAVSSSIAHQPAAPVPSSSTSPAPAAAPKPAVAAAGQQRRSRRQTPTDAQGSRRQSAAAGQSAKPKPKPHVVRVAGRTSAVGPAAGAIVKRLRSEVRNTKRYMTCYFS